MRCGEGGRQRRKGGAGGGGGGGRGGGVGGDSAGEGGGAGVGREHRFDSVRSGENSLDVDGTYFQVDLEPACQIELSVQMQRYSQQPSFLMPWHDDGIAYR